MSEVTKQENVTADGTTKRPVGSKHDKYNYIDSRVMDDQREQR
jgi:hypothetical protein